MHRDVNLCCRVCGFTSEAPPWGADGRSPGYDFCPCCGVEHGYQDATPAGARRFRAAWLAAGANWAEPASRPDAWDWEEQLRCVAPEFS